MKKFLSLVLALVMTMSLVTVSAGAKDFTDSSKVQYTEAVDVMSTLGVVGGYADGSFNPSATLTRGAAAKIICNVILGTTAADALVADAAPYKDVPTSNTFSGYIAYCAKEGIISGYADGTFRPAGTLTGYAFMKMLLGALGLDSEVEGYTGNNWSIAVAKRALSDGVDLTDNLNGDFNGTKAVTREEACLYAFNMIKAVKFTYDTSSTIVVGNVTVKNNSKATQDGNNVYYKDVFTKLKGNDDEHDDLGRPATQWKYDGKEIGTYAQSADAVYTAAANQKDIYNDIDASTGAKLTVYVDGVQLKDNKDATLTTDKYAVLTLSKSNDDDMAKTGNGIITEVYYDSDDNKGTLVIINPVYGEIDDVDTNDNKERIVKVDGYEFVTSQFEEDDSIVYFQNKSTNDKEDRIVEMYAVEKVTGTVSKISGSKYTIGGETYKLSKSDAGTEVNKGVKVDDEVDYCLDANGYIIYMDTSDASATSVDKLAYVSAAGKDRNTDWANLIFADGTHKNVDVTKSATSLVGQIVSYKVQSSGEYKLTEKGSNNTFNVGTVASNAVTTSESNFTYKDNDTKLVVGGKTAKLDANTVFVVVTKYNGDADYHVYTGYKAMPELASGAKFAAAAYTPTGKTTASFVVVLTDKTATSSSDDMIYIVNKDVDLVQEADDVTYYEYNAIIDGKITTIKVDPDEAINGTAHKKDYKITVVKNGSYDSDDIYTDLDLADKGENKDYMSFVVGANNQIKKLTADVLTLDGIGYAVADDVKVFFYDDDQNITEGSVSSIKTDETGSRYENVYYTTNDDGELDFVLLFRK